MGLEIRHANPSDYGRVIQHVNAWWGGRDMAPMLPKLFFLHFEGTSFVAEDDEGKLVAFLIGFLSQTDPEEAYIHFVGVAPDQRGSGIGRELYERFFAVVAAARAVARPLRHLARERGVDRVPRVARILRRECRRGLRRPRRGSSALRQAPQLSPLHAIARLLQECPISLGVRPAAQASSRTLSSRLRSPACSRSQRRASGLWRCTERGTIPAGTTIAGVDVGGMTRGEAIAALEPATDARLGEIDPSDRASRRSTSHRARARRAAAARRLRSTSRSPRMPGERLLRRLGIGTAPKIPLVVPPRSQCGPPSSQTGSTGRFGRAPRDAGISVVEPTGVSVSAPAPGTVVDRAALRQGLRTLPAELGVPLRDQPPLDRSRGGAGCAARVMQAPRRAARGAVP